MLTIWITILFFGYPSFIRRHETKADKRLRGFFRWNPFNSSQLYARKSFLQITKQRLNLWRFCIAVHNQNVCTLLGMAGGWYYLSEIGRQNTVFICTITCEIEHIPLSDRCNILCNCCLFTFPFVNNSRQFLRCHFSQVLLIVSMGL